MAIDPDKILQKYLRKRTKEVKFQDKLKSFGRATLKDLWTFGKDVGATMLTAYLESKLGLQ